VRLRERLPYLAVAAGLFVVLVLIAAFGEGIVRTHGGDLLVVAWLYAGLRMLSLWRPVLAAMLVLLLAVGIEAGQAFGLAERLGLADGAATRLTFGHRFDPLDLLAYALGAAGALFADLLFQRAPVARQSD